MKKLVLLLSLCTSLSTLADSSVGCGLGSLIWKQNTVVSATVRLTTNHSFSSQLFGITSGTSGCSSHSIVKRDMAPIYYAEANLEELKVEMAQGQGEYLVTFAETLGCPKALDPVFAETSKKNYQIIFQSEKTTPSEMLHNVKKVISQESRLQGQCQYAII